jgi:hypothetical protein
VRQRRTFEVWHYSYEGIDQLSWAPACHQITQMAHFTSLEKCTSSSSHHKPRRRICWIFNFTLKNTSFQKSKDIEGKCPHLALRLFYLVQTWYSNHNFGD